MQQVVPHCAPKVLLQIRLQVSGAAMASVEMGDCTEGAFAGTRETSRPLHDPPPSPQGFTLERSGQELCISVQARAGGGDVLSRC